MYNFGKQQLDFPQQKVSEAEKRKAVWYASCIDFVISQGQAMNNIAEYESKINILHGNIPDSFYKKTLNPYNSSNEKYTRFPATMRNLDIMSDVIRRYVGEYSKGVHDFTVGSNDPHIAINRKAKVKEEVAKLCQQAFMQEFQNRMMQMQQEQQQVDPSTGEPVQAQGEINPQQVMTPEEIEQFVKDFETKYIDEKTVEGQKLLEFIQDITKDEEIYVEAYFNFCAFGRFCVYNQVDTDQIIKENVPVNQMYPIPNANNRIEDHDMFARCIPMTKQQIFDTFDKYLTKKDREFFNTYHSYEGVRENAKLLSYNQYFENYPDVCEKFNSEERKLFSEKPINVYDNNGGIYNVWHCCWRSYTRIGILTYINELGMPEQTVVEDGFKFEADKGHINIEWEYVPQVYEGYRIGSRYDSIYPIKARPVFGNNPTKLPYNGILEPIPLMGEFSIIDIITPFQIMRNIFAYHREMVIAKNKLIMLIVPESLLGSGGDDTEDKIYKMAADGILAYDDSVDSNSLKAQQIRLLNASLNNYIKDLTELIEQIKNEAREIVDMTAQRYGLIATSAGKGTTEEAIARGSMGSVTINFAFDKCRCSDYQHNINDAKLAWIDGIDSSYWDTEGTRQPIDIPANHLLYNDYSVMVKNSAKEQEKLDQLRQWAFSAAQNGDLDMALAAVTGNNIASMKATIMKFNEIKRQHEEQMQQAEQMLKQMEIENKLKEIAAKGEEDRKTEELKYYYELQMKYVEADVSLLGDPDTSVQDKNASTERIEEGRREIERMKLDIERQKIASDNYNAAADRNVQREQMKNDLAIARANKNKYDK